MFGPGWRPRRRQQPRRLPSRATGEELCDMSCLTPRVEAFAVLLRDFAMNEDDADLNSKGVKPCTFVLSHSVRADRMQMNKTQSFDGIIGPHHAIRRGGCQGHVHHRLLNP